jgi:type II secretory pathway pseudopilin PulG
MKSARGMTLIDVIVGTALMLIVFLALFGLLRTSLKVSTFIKTQSTAIAIANNQIEYIRSLPYTSVGTVGGIPSGSIPQNSTTTEDGASYGVRTFVDYYDDPADGTGVNDTNGITTDYKRIKVTVTYGSGATARQVVLNSVYAPLGIETTVGGGTLQIIVVNAAGSPVPGATVQITNASTTPTVNLNTFSNSAGVVYLPGATASSQYVITVSKAGYSTAQTYARDLNNQNPTPGYLTVSQNLTTSSTFAIDVLGLLTLETFSPSSSGAFTDSFADASKLTTLTNTTAGGGALTLTGPSGSYPASGTAISTTTTPTSLYSWGVASSTMTRPSGTTAIVQVLDGSGHLIPDSVLPGNAAGFSTFPVNLSGISTTTYPSLALSASLTTSSNTVTPSLTGWSITYQNAPVPLPNVGFTLTGAKTIGTTGGGAPIYKTTVNGNTGTSNASSLSLEWDSYSLAISGYDVQNACGSPPYALSPGASLTEALTLGTRTTNSALITVTDSATGNVVPGASVTLSRSGYTKTVTASSCGAAYFGNLTSASDYSVLISAPGYTNNTDTGVTISGQTFYATSF